MAKQEIGIGSSANDGTGDTLRVALDKVNDNFTELYQGKGITVITGEMAALEPTAAEINTATGLTPVTAGAGYTFLGVFTKSNPTALYFSLIISDGEYWYLNYVTYMMNRTK